MFHTFFKVKTNSLTPTSPCCFWRSFSSSLTTTDELLQNDTLSANSSNNSNTSKSCFSACSNKKRLSRLFHKNISITSNKLLLRHVLLHQISYKIKYYNCVTKFTFVMIYLYLVCACVCACVRVYPHTHVYTYTHTVKCTHLNIGLLCILDT